MNNFTDADIQTAFTRELTDERVATAAAYWLDCSPHERWEPDGIILARYARHAMSQLQQLREELEQVKKERDKLVNEVKYQVQRNDRQLEPHFQFESEQAAKDKVLQWYVDNFRIDFQEPDMKKVVDSIVSRFARSAIESTESGTSG